MNILSMRRYGEYKKTIIYNCRGKKGKFTVDKTLDYNLGHIYKVHST